MYKNTQIIAEVKTESPFGFKSEKSWDKLFSVANEVGDMISIHTDPRWGGSFELIKKAKLLTNEEPWANATGYPSHARISQRA